MCEDKEKKSKEQLELEGVGLECLSSAALALIVEADLREYGKLRYEGCIAFRELIRRDPNYGGLMELKKRGGN